MGLFPFILAGCDQFVPSEPLILQGNTMGTTYSITIAEPPPSVVENELTSTIEALLQAVNQQMSTYIDDSEISKFNQAPVNTWQTISADFIKVVMLSQTLSEQSEGRFDVTIGPLINLWGFGRQTSSTVPSDAAIAAAKAKIGWQALEINEATRQIRKTKPIELNLSAIAKGFGVDKIAESLESKGIENYLVEIGGEIRVKGVNPSGNTWRLGIEKPSLNQQQAQQIIALIEGSIATSGDYRNYFEEGGVRYSHTIDPSSGKPVRHSIASVTVIAATAALADGYATALNVMGIDDALALAEAEKLSVFFILYDQTSDTGYREVYSSQFTQYINP